MSRFNKIMEFEKLGEEEKQAGKVAVAFVAY